MQARSLALNVVRAVAFVLAVAILLLTPLIIESPSGRSYDPAGVVLDLVALVTVIAVAWTAFGNRLRLGGR